MNADGHRFLKTNKSFYLCLSAFICGEKSFYLRFLRTVLRFFYDIAPQRQLNLVFISKTGFHLMKLSRKMRGFLWPDHNL